MKTLILYSDGMEEPKGCIVEGDFTIFDGVVVNGVKGNGFENEFCKWFFNQESGAFNFEMLPVQPLIESKDWDKVALCTFLP